ncbi:hypothetical protein M5689_019255 [Euphorbia peplus]|nr:hypothetical protein M5689_019255 [Euphorbia peplus]
MGCFLACFGSSKDRRKNRHRRNVHVQVQAQVQIQQRDNRNVGFKQAQPNVFVAQSNPIPAQPIIVPVSDIRVKPEKQLSLSPRKKVTFDSNVTTYEHFKVEESTELLPVEKEDGSIRKEKEENLEKQRQPHQSSSQDSSSVTSSSGSYPSNHRYQNCRDSDDELDYGESDVDADDEDEDDDFDDDDGGVLEYDDTLVENEKLGSNCKTPVPDSSLAEKDVQPNPNARDRSAYVNSVLNPVENLTQWKAVKAKGTPPLNQQKENLTANQEPPNPFSSEPGFRFSFKEKSEEQSKKSDNEIAVDASLSNWLGSSESTPINRPSSPDLSTATPEKSSISIGSNSPKIFQDRPILGALTVEEIKQFSATSSPKRSPSRSPDDMPIIGTVGTYWNNNNVSGKSPGSASSFKGIPNTTSKYGEDKRVNWHSTPFETRLERALKETGAC